MTFAMHPLRLQQRQQQPQQQPQQQQQHGRPLQPTQRQQHTSRSHKSQQLV